MTSFTEQIGLAYKMYKGTGKSNAKLSQGFRQTFSRLVKIEFMGCWSVKNYFHFVLSILRCFSHRDTVSSVGLFWGRHLPFSASTTIIKRFRHALSLDEVSQVYFPLSLRSPSAVSAN